MPDTYNAIQMLYHNEVTSVISKKYKFKVTQKNTRLVSVRLTISEDGSHSLRSLSLIVSLIVVTRVSLGDFDSYRCKNLGLHVLR